MNTVYFIALILFSLALWIPLEFLRDSYYRQLREDLRAAEREPPKRRSRFLEHLLNLFFPKG